MTTKMTHKLYFYDEKFARLQELWKLLKCLEVSSHIRKEFDVVDKDTRILILRSRPLYAPAHIIKCLMSLIKDEVLEGRSIHCVIQSEESIKCTVANFHHKTLSVLNSYGIQNWKAFDVFIEAAICKIMEEQETKGELKRLTDTCLINHPHPRSILKKRMIIDSTALSPDKRIM